MIPCERCEELINARLDGSLTEEEALLLEDHLAQCPDCQRLDRDLTTLQRRLKNLSSAPPQSLASSVMTRLEDDLFQPTIKKRHPWAVLAFAAAAMVLLTVAPPQLSLFGGSDGESAGATETVQPPASADTAADAAPAEGEAAAPEESRTESETQESQVEPMTEKEAHDLLVEYLIDMGVSLDLSPGTLSENGAVWTFTGHDMDSGERFLFSISCADGFVEEVPLS